MILSGKEKTALLAGKFFAFLPVTVLTCCFPIKDIFLTWATLYVFYVFLQLDVNQTPKVREVVLCAICLIGIYYTRGAVAELLMVFLAAIMFHRYWMLKNYRAVLVVSMISLIAAAFFGDSVVDALRTKTEDYSDYNTMSTGFLSLLQMQSTRQFYKLPFAYVYASFQPMVLKIFGSNISSWLQAISIANISIYPIAIANAVYIFQKKHHKLFWFAGVAMLCAVISVSLGIFRHYLFLMPLIFINGALCFEKLTKNGKVVILICSAGVFLLVALYSML